MFKTLIHANRTHKQLTIKKYETNFYLIWGVHTLLKGALGYENTNDERKNLRLGFGYLFLGAVFLFDDG